MKPETCRRCGTCCRNGGPALHVEDLPLFKNGTLTTGDLITIRRGEPAASPISGRIEPATVELIKLNGTGSSWVCCFYQGGDSACGIYKHRPVECRTLKCWDTESLTGLIFKNTISRFDLIEPNDPLTELLEQHERECPYENLQAARLKNVSQTVINICRQTINNDLAIRQQAIEQYGLSLAQELFYFGRPMFKSMEYFGLRGN